VSHWIPYATYVTERTAITAGVPLDVWSALERAAVAACRWRTDRSTLARLAELVAAWRQPASGEPEFTTTAPRHDEELSQLRAATNP
jgi:HAMP domain-containing protein